MTTAMKLIKVRGPSEEAFSWYWINSNEVVLSPSFCSKNEAMTWYNLHEMWMEDPTIEDSDEENTAYDG